MTSADNNNGLLIPKVLHYLLSKFTIVILVSHIDEIKDIVDIKINISKKKIINLIFIFYDNLHILYYHMDYKLITHHEIIFHLLFYFKNIS